MLIRSELFFFDLYTMHVVIEMTTAIAITAAAMDTLTTTVVLLSDDSSTEFDIRLQMLGCANS